MPLKKKKIASYNQASSKGFMIELVLIFFVGKAFYDLAGRHKKHQWGFAILGSYYKKEDSFSGNRPDGIGFTGRSA